MVGHQPEEFNVIHGKQTSGALRWTLGFFILLIWGALMAYIGYLAAQTIFTKTVIEELSEITTVEDNGEQEDVMEEEQETVAVQSFALGGTDLPSFDFPQNWHVYYNQFPSTSTLQTLTVDDGPIAFADGEQFFPARIVVLDRSTYSQDGTGEDFVARQSDDYRLIAPGYYEAEGTFELGGLDYQMVIFLTVDTIVQVVLTEVPGVDATDLDVIHDSLDFSNVQ